VISLADVAFVGSAPATFYAFAAARGCCVCGDRPVQLHHISHPDLPRRGHHLVTLTVVPLCHRHHLTGRDSVHAVSQPDFERLHGLRLEQIMLKIYGEFAVSHELELPPGLSARQAGLWLLEVGLT